ncbi:MAG: hypothetical protein GXP55_05380 [Deltaproteobacteria bacterium]|nr:hypothetical protein [Deltaproteobacteria bacterium]
MALDRRARFGQYPNSMALPAASRDAYANLLRDTRGLRREQATARESWYAALPWKHKEQTLFELEVLLKGFACFGNARNQAGPPRRTSELAHDFREELGVVAAALERAIECTRELLGERERAYAFTRYLESVTPGDVGRERLLREQLSQVTPQESLFVLRNTFGAFFELAGGLAQKPHLPHRLYHALLGTITREVGRNAYFDPLIALEFRPEFDRIRSPEALEALASIESDSVHRVVALTMLSLFRTLRYVELVDQYATDARRSRLGYLVLAVLRSDLRTLTRHLGTHAGDIMADGLERELLALPMADVAQGYAALSDRLSKMTSLRGLLASMANSLRLEVKRSFERDLPNLESAPVRDELGPVLVVATASLRASIHHAIGAVCQELVPGVVPPVLGSKLSSQRRASERLRRDVWMFSRVLRGFLAKAKAATGDPDRWAESARFAFVREFLRHFRAIGYQLVRASDYEGIDRFMVALETLRDVDLLDPDRLQIVVAECEAFYAHLDALFAQVSRRQELSGHPFDKKEAAETLKLYLGAA